MRAYAYLFAHMLSIALCWCIDQDNLAIAIFDCQKIWIICGLCAGYMVVTSETSSLCYFSYMGLARTIHRYSTRMYVFQAEKITKYIGLARTVYIYTVYDRKSGDFPAQKAIYTPCMYGSGQPYNYRSYTVHDLLILLMYTMYDLLYMMYDTYIYGVLANSTHRCFLLRTPNSCSKHSEHACLQLLPFYTAIFELFCSKPAYTARLLSALIGS